LAEAAFVYPVPVGYSDVQAAPLLCAGIIGYRALLKTGLGYDQENGFQGVKLGIYGFGAAGHVVIQLARKRGAKVYVITRQRTKHHKLAEELGAEWVGGLEEKPPALLDASIIFAPSGDLVPIALESLHKGGTLVLGGIHMSPTPNLAYSLLYEERTICSVANNTREDGRAFLQEATNLKIDTHVQVFPMSEANLALDALKNHGITGEGVLVPESASKI
jgi:propanol-preferring alcohol dehydrogenase